MYLTLSLRQLGFNTVCPCIDTYDSPRRLTLSLIVYYQPTYYSMYCNRHCDATGHHMDQRTCQRTGNDRYDPEHLDVALPHSPKILVRS